MAVIIGNSTIVDTTLFADGGIVSVNFGFSPQVNRLWQLGSFDPYDTYVQRQRQVSITAYGKKEDGSGGSQVFDLTPSTSCTDASSVEITVSPGICEISTVLPFQDDFFPTSYSYSKGDRFGYGQESWSFVGKPILEGYGGTIYMLRGLSTGNMQVGDGVMTGVEIGIVIDDSASRDSNGDYIEDSTGSVSAGPLSMGEWVTTRDVVVSSVGGSEAKADGYIGNGSASVNNQPVYL